MLIIINDGENLDNNEMKELVKELKAYIEYEPRSANEMNSSAR